MSLLPHPHGTDRFQNGFRLEVLVNNPFIWPTILIVQVLLYSSYSIFINLSRIDGHVKYQSSSTVLSTEMMKFVLALLIAWPEVSSKGMPKIRLGKLLPFSVPAVCYCLNNNMAIYMQDQMDPATFQVLCNLKIASTAFFYRVIMKKRLRSIQWVSLCLLVFAGGINSYSGFSEKSLSLKEIHITIVGLLMALIYSSISGFSGVYTEYILKQDYVLSLPFQNCFLYSFGILLNLVVWIFQVDDSFSFFNGYTSFTWAFIVCQALNGLVMSLIMKHSNNIVRLFVISSAIPVTTGLSVLIFQLQPDFVFVIVVLLVILAIFLYSYASKN